MSSLASIKIQIQSLITLANATTGKNDTTLTDCVNTLILGYGQASEPTPTYTNLIPTAQELTSTAIYGADYNGDGKNDGYKEGIRIGSDGTDRNNVGGTDATGLMPCTKGQKIYFKNCSIVWGDGKAQADNQCMGVFDSTKKHLGTVYLKTLDKSVTDYFILDENDCFLMLNTSPMSNSAYGTMAYVRFSGINIDGNSIITVDELIE